MNYLNFNPKQFFSCTIIVLILSSCNGQNGNKDICMSNYLEAKKKFNKFYADNNAVLLSDALKAVEKSLDCPETRIASIELKISALSLLKKYDKAYQFVDSLKENDFSKSYKKKMQYNFLKAMSYESKSKITDRNIYCNKAILEIQTFINNEKTIDQEAYYDLFLVKSKILNSQQISEEINNLKTKYPTDKDFFESLKESFNNDTKQINASVK